MDVNERLKELGIVLPSPPKPAGLYVPCRLRGNVLYTSGQDCRINGELAYAGKLGKDLSVEEGYDAARLTMLNCLALIQEELGNLNRVKKIVKLLSFVHSTDDFIEQPSVINGASQVLIDVFGEAGKHARTALSANSLPFNIPLEIEMILEFQ